MAKKPASSKTAKETADDASGGSSTPAKRFKGAAASNAPSRVVALVGPELFLHTEHTRRIKDALTAAHGEIDIVRFDGDSVDASVVLDECRTFALMIQHKLIIVDTADKFVNAATRPMLERYVAEPADSATLVLRSINTWVPGKLGESMDARGGMIRCEAPKEAELPSFIMARAREAHHVTIEPEAVTVLVDRLGADLARLDNELAKLAAGLPKAEAGAPESAYPAITGKHARVMVGMTREEEVWSLQGDLVAGSPEQAVRAVRNRIEVSRQPTTLVSFACVDLTKKLSVVSRATAAGMNPFQAAGKAKVWGSARDAILNTARRLGPAASASALRTSIETDAAQKTGLGDPQRSLERLALKLAVMTSPASRS